MEDKIPYHLISKHLAGETTEQEDESLWQWMDESPAHLNLFNQLIDIYANTLVKINSEERDKIFERVLSKNKPNNKVRVVEWFLRIAASIAIIVTVGVYLNKGNSPEWIEVKTIAGEVKEIVLPDNTKVLMNGNTTIRYAKYNFLEERWIELSGEAFFKVEPESITPLQVMYDSVVLLISAGEFNVESLQHKNESVTTVSQGEVEFIDLRKDGLSLWASTGQQVISKAGYGLLSVELSNNVNFDSWFSGLYVFYKTPVVAVAELLSKDHGIEISVPENNLRYKSLTGVFEDYDASQLLSEVLLLLDAEIEQTGNQYFILKNKNS
jgi:transmembrane sensor